MKITDKIKIDWHHDVPQKSTTCIIIVDENQVSASAKCGHGDQFSKKIGRKVSLTKALKETDFDKSTRSTIWAVIWNRGVKI